MTDPRPLDEATPLPDHPPGAILRCDSDLLGVLVTHDWRKLIAIKPIAAGKKVFTLVGRETPIPTRYSIQVGPSLHVDQDDAHDPSEIVRRYFWRYMDHACDPATLIRHRAVIARRDIAAGEALTFNYNTTEYDMAEPFRCHCESALCVGLVRGARYLTPGQRALIEDWLADYLR
ncbi:MAG TPA: SET domain-containing protein-lysine N-methyltransferase [Gemmatimonadaceae bacterium]|jgi:hypothetical protein